MIYVHIFSKASLKNQTGLVQLHRIGLPYYIILSLVEIRQRTYHSRNTLSLPGTMRRNFIHIILLIFFSKVSFVAPILLDERIDPLQYVVKECFLQGCYCYEDKACVCSEFYPTYSANSFVHNNLLWCDSLGFWVLLILCETHRTSAMLNISKWSDSGQY